MRLKVNVDRWSYPKTISNALKLVALSTWHILASSDTSCCPVIDFMMLMMSSLEQEDGKQTPQCTTVELFSFEVENDVDVRISNRFETSTKR